MKPTPASVNAAAAHKRIAALCAAMMLATAARAGGEEDAAASVSFTQDFTALCGSRSGVQILVRNTHPTRSVRVWLDRIHMGIGTGDRSRSDLAPGAEPEPLGCSRSLTGPQEWRVVRAVFLD